MIWFKFTHFKSQYFCRSTVAKFWTCKIFVRVWRITWPFCILPWYFTALIDILTGILRWFLLTDLWQKLLDDYFYILQLLFVKMLKNDSLFLQTKNIARFYTNKDKFSVGLYTILVNWVGHFYFEYPNSIIFFVDCCILVSQNDSCVADASQWNGEKNENKITKMLYNPTEHLSNAYNCEIIIFFRRFVAFLESILRERIHCAVGLNDFHSLCMQQKFVNISAS